MVPKKADGSLLYDKSGNIIGSALIAQPFSADEYFHPRPSAVSYNAASTAGSNWARTITCCAIEWPAPSARS